MQKLQDSSFSILKTTGLSPAVFSFLQPTDDSNDTTPLGGILNDTRHGWLALASKFCVIDLKSGLKIAAWTFGANTSSTNYTVTSVEELPTPLTENSLQLVISLECEDSTGLIAVFHVNGSQILRCIQTEVVVTQLTVCDVPDGPFVCFDSLIVAGTSSGEILVFDLNRAALLQALKDIIQGNDQVLCNEQNMTNLTFLPLKAISQISEQRDLALENEEHIALLLNENSLVDGQYLFHNPDGTVRMKAKRDHVRVSTMQYIPQLGSVTVGYNFGAFQIWNLMTLDLEFTSQVNVECLPVTHFGFQEPCDDPRAFCYLWVVYSVLDRFQEEHFPLAVMYSLTYQGKRMLSDTKCLYQDFVTSNIRFQVELCSTEGGGRGGGAGAAGGRAVSCNTFSINSTLGDEGEDSTLNICQLVWECWQENATFASEYGMLLFDLDQWYKDQMPATYQLQSNTFMCVSCWEGGAGGGGGAGAGAGEGRLLAARLQAGSVAPYSHATRLEEHFYPNSLQHNCICLNTSEVVTLHTPGVQRQIIASIQWLGERALLSPSHLYQSCLRAGLTPLYAESRGTSIEQQRRFLLSVALEARLAPLLARAALAWATGAHAGAGCTLPAMVDWCWKRALELKQNAKELTAPLFTSSALPDRNVVRCLEHCVRQLTELTGLLDTILTKCCNLVVPDALSSMEEKHRSISCVALYFRLVQWLLGAGLLPERRAPAAPDAPASPRAPPTLLYPARELADQYRKRRIKLHRLQNGASDAADDAAGARSCALLYVDQLIEHECGGELVYELWREPAGGAAAGLYPPRSLQALLRLYLRPAVPDEHKHSLVLYLLLDYSAIYNDARYETVIRRLMQFPTMFGLSNTAIKATQAFWHLDHRDFDFALDQLQCLTGNTLTEWQHNVVLSALLAQRKTQQALQYLHVRKPPPKASNDETFNEYDKLECWQASCDLYLARGLVFEALDVIRMCVASAATFDDKLVVMNYFFKGCRNTGQLHKMLEVSLQPFEEEVFVRFLEGGARAGGDLLVMYYLQQARYLEAQQCNSRLTQSKPQLKETDESLAEWASGAGGAGAGAAAEAGAEAGATREAGAAREALLGALCGALPRITGRVAHSAMYEFDAHAHVLAPKPMSVFVQAKSPKNMFTYKSSFIQDTIENASETWINKPQMRKGLKRALNIEEIPFLCTPKLNRNRSNFNSTQDITEGTPPKRLKLELSPRTPKLMQPTAKISEQLTREIETLLDMPEQASPRWRRALEDRGTPHSILKARRCASSCAGGDVDDDCSDKHLRFEIPSTVSEYGSSPSPQDVNMTENVNERERSVSAGKEREEDVSGASYKSTTNRDHVLVSPPKPEARKSYKDNVRARRSLSISASSSLCEDANMSVESIADLPYTLLPAGCRPGARAGSARRGDSGTADAGRGAPRGRKPINNRGLSVTPERMDSPVAASDSIRKLNRSRSRTPERSCSLEPIAELEAPAAQLPSSGRRLRRVRTPERAPAPAPAPSPEPEPAPIRTRLRNRSRTPEVVEKTKEVPPSPATPRNLRSRSKTPEREKVLTPQEKPPKTRKSLSRMVLENNLFKPKPTEDVEKSDQSDNSGESTPKKPANEQPPNLMDVTFSPINKSVLQSPVDSFSESDEKGTDSEKVENKSIAFTTFSETYYEKSVLKSYQSSAAENSSQANNEILNSTPKVIKMENTLHFTTLNETDYDKSVLKSYQSSVGDNSTQSIKETASISKVIKMDPLHSSNSKSVLKDGSSLMTSDSDTDHSKVDNSVQKEKQRIVEIEREIHEIEVDISDDEQPEESSSSDEEDEENAGDDHNDEEQVENDVISIGDTTDDSSDTIPLNIDEYPELRQSRSDSESRNAMEEVNIYEGFETIEDNKKIETKEKEENKTDDKSAGYKFTLSETTAYSELVDHPASKNIETAQSSKATEESTKKHETKEESQVKHSEVKDTMTEDAIENQPSADDNKAEDPLAQSVSLLTDDNSMLSDQSDVNLNYSDDNQAVEESKAEETQSTGGEKTEQEATEVAVVQPQVQIDIIVEKVEPEHILNVPVDIDIDVVDAAENPVEDHQDQDMETKKVSRTRKRIKSTSSNKSTNEEPELSEKAKTPIRKRTKSTSSNKSEENETPNTVRRILTRRASKELAEKSANDTVDLEESVTVTPKRRARSKSKTEDSDSSVKSKEEAPVRKGRKSILATKPDLSVIPEILTEEGASRSDESEHTMMEYSKTRRLTRNQKSILESCRESPAARASPAQMEIAEEEFDGSPDEQDMSPVFIPEVKPKRRLSRAASETKTSSTQSSVKPKPIRRGSIDVANLTASELAVSPSPGRARRASFTRAVQALTPRRRASADQPKSDSTSERSSPAPSLEAPPSPAPAPAPRARRVASAQSNASAQSDTPRRPRKASTPEPTKRGKK